MLHPAFRIEHMDPGAPAEPSKRWRVTLRTKGVAVLAIPIVALFSALVAVYGLEADLQTADRVVVRSYEIHAGLLELRGLLIDAQAGVAHFSATKHERHLAAFDDARRGVGEAQARLIANAAGDPRLPGWSRCAFRPPT